MCNAFVAMYDKDTSIEDACRVFEKINKQDVITWNAMNASLVMLLISLYSFTFLIFRFVDDQLCSLQKLMNWSYVLVRTINIGHYYDHAYGVIFYEIIYHFPDLCSTNGSFHYNHHF